MRRSCGKPNICDGRDVCTSATITLHMAGKELLSDAVLLKEAGLHQDQCVVNVMRVPLSNTFSSPDPAALQALEAASPTLLLSCEVTAISLTVWL